MRAVESEADISTIIVLASLCVVVFAGCFLVGRAGSPRTAPSQPVLPSVAAVAAHSPLQIGNAPAIAAVAIPRPAPKPSAHPKARNGAASVAAVVVSFRAPGAPVALRAPRPAKPHAPPTSFDTSG